MKKYVYLSRKKYLSHFKEQFKSILPMYSSVDEDNVTKVASMVKKLFDSGLINVYTCDESGGSMHKLHICKEYSKPKQLSVKLTFTKTTNTSGEFDFEKQQFKEHVFDIRPHYYLEICDGQNPYYNMDFFIHNLLYIDDKCIVHKGYLFVIAGMEDELDENIKSIFIDPLKEE